MSHHGHRFTQAGIAGALAMLILAILKALYDGFRK